MRIDPMTPADLDRVLDWAAEEGWNPGLDDAAAFRAADPAGFLMGWVGGEPAVAIAAVRHSPDFGFLGLYICAPRFRGRGHGMAIWQTGMAHLGERTVGLDAVVAQQANYTGSGFVPSHRLMRFRGEIEPAADPAVVPVRPEHLPQLLARDAVSSGVERGAYLTAWFTDAATRRTVVLERDGNVEGYGTIRACRSGAKVGPLHAVDASEAARILGILAGRLPTKGGLLLDVPEPNHVAMALARDLGLEQVFETARMYRGPAPEQDLGSVFGVVSLELG